MDQRDRMAAIEREKGTGTIRSQVGPWLLPCVWDECDKPARREHMSVIPEGEKTLFYFFCSIRHQVLWRNSPRDNGNLPMGSKSLVS
jgi:hypothetical protein